MKIFASVTVGILLLLLFPATPLQAQATNPGFETGDFTGWTVQYAINKTNILGNQTFSTWKSSPMGGQLPARIITASTPTPPDQVIDVDPYGGSHMALINDLVGDQRATRLLQTFHLASFVGCAELRVKWGAMLEEASDHTAEQQAFFLIEIKRNNVPFYSFRADASAAGAAGSGWTEIDPTAMLWYRHETFTTSLCGVEAGDDLTVVMTVAGCTEGGHGAIAFLDDVDVGNACERSCLPRVQKTIPDPIIANVFTPNGDGINDTWGIVQVYFACCVQVEIFDRDGLMIYSGKATRPEGYDGGAVPLWDGVMKNGAAAIDGTYYYIVTLRNCSETRSFPGFLTIFH